MHVFYQVMNDIKRGRKIVFELNGSIWTHFVFSNGFTYNMLTKSFINHVDFFVLFANMVDNFICDAC